MCDTCLWTCTQKTVRQEANTKVENMTTELRTVRQELERRVQDFGSTTEKLQGSQEKRLREMQLQHQQEVEALVRDSNDKYHAMLTQRLEEMERMRDELEEEHQKKLENALKVRGKSGERDDGARTLEECAEACVSLSLLLLEVSSVGCILNLSLSLSLSLSVSLSVFLLL